MSQCIMGNGHKGTSLEKNDTCENITFRQLCLRAVTTRLLRLLVTTKHQNLYSVLVSIRVGNPGLHETVDITKRPTR